MRRALATVAVAAAAATQAAPAWAHATLVRSTPPDDAVLATPPRDVRLWFSEPLVREFSTAQILDREGRRVAGSRIRAGREPGLLILSAPNLGRGTYVVTWKVLSRDDGHVRRGFIVFGVGERADARAASLVAGANKAPLFEIGLRWLTFALLTAVAGALVVARLVVPFAPRAQRRVLTWGALTAAGGIGASVGLLLLQAREVADSDGFATAGGRLLTETRWGALWLVRAGILLGLVGALLVLRRRRSGLGREIAFAVAAALVIAVMTVQALGGHAAGLSSGRAPALVADTVHLLGAGAWAGGLVAVLVALWPLRREPVLHRSLKRFGVVATLSVGLLAASGLYSMGRQVASLDALLTTFYGRALLAKSAFVLAAGTLGLSTWLHLRFARSGARVPTLVAAEAGCALLILLGAAVITASVPARGPEFEPAPKVAVSERTQSVDDLLVTVSAKPNQPGDNVFTVQAVNTRRPPPAEIRGVVLRFYSPDGRLLAARAARRIEPDRYRLAGRYLSQAGSTRLDAVVQRPGLRDGVAQFDWTVAPARQREILVSDRPLRPILSAAAAGLALGLLILAAAGALVRPSPFRARRRITVGDVHEETS